jgi:hypothetical protein
MNNIIQGISPELPVLILGFLDSIEGCPDIRHLLMMKPNELYGLLMDLFETTDDESDEALNVEVSMLHLCLLCDSELDDEIVKHHVIPWCLREYIRSGGWDRSDKWLNLQLINIARRAKPIHALCQAA